MKKNETELFYEKMYAEGREGKRPSGFLGKIFLFLQKYELHRVEAALQLLENGNTLLDMGCGDGGFIYKAKKMGLFNKYYGVDIAKPVVQRALRNIKKFTGDTKSVYIIKADLNKKLPFPSSSFEFITCLSVFEHLFDPYFSIKEMNRLLKPGGFLILEIPNIAWLPRRLSLMMGTLPITGDEEGWDGGHLHYFTFSTVKNLLLENGYRITFIGSTGIFPKIRNVWPSILGGNILVKAKKIENAKN